jgi:tetratricopeptide (TPR) repeat protein
MKALFFALSLFCAVPAFAETELQEAPQIDSDKKQIQDDKKEAKKKNKEGLALLKQKKFYEASESFAEATNLDPDNAHYFNNYGLSLLKSSDPFYAIDQFKLALDLGLNKAFVWNNLGMSYEHTNQLDEARSAYLKASQKGSTSAEKNYQRIKNVKYLRVESLEGFGCGGGDEEYLPPPIELSPEAPVLEVPVDGVPAPTTTPENAPTPTPEPAATPQ